MAATLQLPETATESQLLGCVYSSSCPTTAAEAKPCSIFEPVYWLHDDTLLGLMRQRYIEVTDQNRNLVVLLHEYQKKAPSEYPRIVRAYLG